MKNLWFLLIFSVFTLTTFSTGCKKDDDIVSNSELILGNWQLTGHTVNPALPIFGSDLYNQYDNCEKDNLFIFESNGVTKVDEGATKCDAADPQTITGTYTFNPDKTIITLSIDGVDTSLTITELTSSKLVATEAENSTGVNYTYTYTFTKK